MVSFVNTYIEAYLESDRTSIMELICENSQRLLTVNWFGEKASPYMFDKVLNALLHMIHCAIWYHMHNFKNVKNTHGRVLLLVKLQALACNFT